MAAEAQDQNASIEFWKTHDPESVPEQLRRWRELQVDESEMIWAGVVGE